MVKWELQGDGGTVTVRKPPGW